MFEPTSSLEQIKNQVEGFVEPSPWDRLKTATASMDVAQIGWVMNQPDVVKAYSALQTAFQSWLFEKCKDEFGKVQTYKPLVENYINAVLGAAQGYGQHTLNLEAENAALRKQLEELKNA